MKPITVQRVLNAGVLDPFDITIGAPVTSFLEACESTLEHVCSNAKIDRDLLDTPIFKASDGKIYKVEVIAVMKPISQKTAEKIKKEINNKIAERLQKRFAEKPKTEVI